MEIEDLNNIYESTRTLLLNSEPILKLIEVFQNKNLKNRLKELLQITQTDLLVLIDFVYECTMCELDNDLDFFLNGDDYTNEVN
jgi:hypothetical protein